MCGRPSYVDGRLRLAEREKHRKAKPSEQTMDVPSEEELKERQAQADAIMAELLAEEQKERKAEEQQAAKRKAKKDKKKKRKDAVKEDGPKKEDHADADLCAGDSSEAIAEDEDKSSIVSGALDVETVESFAALNLSDSGISNSVTGQTEKSRGKKQKAKEKDRELKRRPKDKAKERDKKGIDQVREQEENAPEELKRKEKRKIGGEAAGPSSSKGTIKIICCHNTATPIISSAKRSSVHSINDVENQRMPVARTSAASSSSNRDHSSDLGKEKDSVGRIKAQRTSARRKAVQSQQNDGHHSTLISNGPVPVPNRKKSSLEGSIPSSTPSNISSPGKSGALQASPAATSTSASPKTRKSAQHGVQQQTPGAQPVALRTPRSGPTRAQSQKPRGPATRQPGQLQGIPQSAAGASAAGQAQGPQPFTAVVSPQQSRTAPQSNARPSAWQHPNAAQPSPAGPTQQTAIGGSPVAKTSAAKSSHTRPVTEVVQSNGAGFPQSPVSQAQPKEPLVRPHPSQQVRTSAPDASNSASASEPGRKSSTQRVAPSAAGSEAKAQQASSSEQGGLGPPSVRMIVSSSTVSCSQSDKTADPQSKSDQHVKDDGKDETLQGARPWGPFGSMQGVRPTVSAPPLPSAWTSQPQQQGRPDDASVPQPAVSNQPTDRGRINGRATATHSDVVKSPHSREGTGSVPVLSSPSPLPSGSPSVSRVDFPFPGRMEGCWGVTNAGSSGQLNVGLLGQSGSHESTTLPNMHSGLGERIVPPPVSSQQPFSDMYVSRKPDGGEQYAHGQPVQSWDSHGHAHNPEYLCNQGPGVPVMYPTPWNQPLGAGAGGPFPQGGGRSMGLKGGGGLRFAKQLRMGGADRGTWGMNSPQPPSTSNGMRDTDRNTKPGTRGSVANIPDDPWEIGDTQKPEPRGPRRRSPQPIQPAPNTPGRNQFCCPLTNKLMVDPVVAADGFTYERSAIEGWLAQNNKSPMTQQPLLHRDLVPNLTMRAAIKLLVPTRK